MSAALICKGIPVLWLLTGHMNCEPLKADPEPQKIVCSGPSVPLLTVPEAEALPRKVQVFMGKVKRNRKDNHCPS